MKTYKVYEIINSLGTIEWVGVSYRPEYRFGQHTRTPSGRFYSRQDLIINIVAEFNDRKNALELEEQLQIKYKLQTDRSKKGFKTGAASSVSGKKNGKILGRLKRKLTFEQAEEIRTIYANGNIFQKELAKRFGVSRGIIAMIINNNTYTEK